MKKVSCRLGDRGRKRHRADEIDRDSGDRLELCCAVMLLVGNSETTPVICMTSPASTSVNPVEDVFGQEPPSSGPQKRPSTVPERRGGRRHTNDRVVSEFPRAA